MTDDLKEAFIALREGLEEAKKAANPSLALALEKWGRDVKTLSKQNLARPSWLLTSSIVDKVKNYDKNSKVWAMVGFNKTDSNPRSPGIYGRYHEAGWAPDRKTINVPDHFLRRAKLARGAKLKQDVNEALKDVVKAFEDTVKGFK